MNTEEVRALSPLLVPARESARLLGMSKSFFHQLVAEGVLPPPLKYGRKSLWSRKMLEASVDAKANKLNHKG